MPPLWQDALKKGNAQSRNTYNSVQYRSTKCSKAYFRSEGIGWFANGMMRISYQEKKMETKIIKDEDLPPVIWTKKEFDEFYKKVPELALFD